jgi:hypothetical protein
MQAPIAEATALQNDRSHALAKAGIFRPSRSAWRQQPMALADYKREAELTPNCPSWNVRAVGTAVDQPD